LSQAKKTAKELAILGGHPAFEEPLHVGRPNIGDREKFMARMNDILDRRWLTNAGRYVQEFEQRVAEYVGVKHCIAMCNGTVALEIAARALDLTGEVIVPTFTFVATPHALQWQGITPVFCDIDPDNYCIDTNRMEDLITPRTTGIVGVHLWGRPCDVDGLTEIAGRRNLKLLFDAAHAFGCTYKGRSVGGFGNCEVFSFHATKFINTFEGGAVVTNDDELADKIRLMKNFGFSGYDQVTYIGTNGKMSEPSAAMGLTSLESISEFISINRRNYEEYCSNLEGIDGLRVLRYDEDEQNNYQYIILEIDKERTTLTRDQLVHVLHAENVLARRYFYPGCHRMEPYRSYVPYWGQLVPVVEKLAQRCLALPTGQAMSTQDVRVVCGILRLSLSHAAELTAAWNQISQQDCRQVKVGCPETVGLR
jgi:dTDP-4-amino-4,6-dideoxygalactose transaminase